MANSYNSSFTGQHIDEYDARITALQNKLAKIDVATDGIVFFGRVHYNTLSGSTINSTYFSDLLKYLCTTYPNKTNTLFIGIAHPNSQGICMINIYDTSAVTDGLPQYSSGFYIGLTSSSDAGWTDQFGTNNYTYYYKNTERKNYGFYKSNASAFNVTTTRVTYGSITITTTGRPVFVICSGDFNPSSTSAWMNMWLIRDGIGLSHDIVESHANSWNIPFCISYLDIVPAGTHTYQIDFLIGSGTANLAENGALQQPDFSVFEI